ncbi:hypothetical protein MYVA_1370 [Mycolicibacterium vaccae 95051]|nr:hypothetical protein MYVA_1370 [Mycolicibacterium vaccae 95051]
MTLRWCSDPAGRRPPRSSAIRPPPCRWPNCPASPRPARRATAARCCRCGSVRTACWCCSAASMPTRATTCGTWCTRCGPRVRPACIPWC